MRGINDKSEKTNRTNPEWVRKEIAERAIDAGSMGVAFDNGKQCFICVNRTVAFLSRTGRPLTLTYPGAQKGAYYAARS